MKIEAKTYDHILKEYLTLLRIQDLPESEYDYEKDFHIPSENCVKSVNKMLMSDRVEYHCLHCHSIFPESMLREDFLGNMQGCPRCDAAGLSVDIRRSDQGDDFVAGVLLQSLVSPDEARKSGYDGIQIDWHKKRELYEKYGPEPEPEPDPEFFIIKYFNLHTTEIEEHEIKVCDLQMIYEIMQELERISERTKTLDNLRGLGAPEIIIEGESDRLNKRIADFYKIGQMTVERATKQEISAISKLVDIYLERRQKKPWKKHSKWKIQFETINELYEEAISSDNRRNDIFQKGIRMRGSGFSKQ